MERLEFHKKGWDCKTGGKGWNFKKRKIRKGRDFKQGQVGKGRDSQEGHFLSLEGIAYLRLSHWFHFKAVLRPFLRVPILF